MRIIRPNAGFIIPEKRFVDVGMPRAQVQFKGRYRLTVRNKSGAAVRGTDWFPNIILNSGLNRWGSGGIISGAAIGTGTSTPDATQTALDTQATWTATAGTGNGTFVNGVSPDYNARRIFVYRTALGALSGNYSEVGVGWASGAMFSRALILDGGGSPTTISVASDEQLDIEYELQVFPPLTDWTGTVSIAGVGSVDVTGRARNVTSAGYWGAGFNGAISLGNTSENVVGNGTLGAVTGSISGSIASPNSLSTDAYSGSSYSRTGAVSYGLTSGNVSGGVNASSAVWLSSTVTIASFQYSYDTTIAKDATKTLVLNYSISWARRP